MEKNINCKICEIVNFESIKMEKENKILIILAEDVFVKRCEECKKKGKMPHIILSLRKNKDDENEIISVQVLKDFFYEGKKIKREKRIINLSGIFSDGLHVFFQDQTPFERILEEIKNHQTK